MWTDYIFIKSPSLLSYDTLVFCIIKAQPHHYHQQSQVLLNQPGLILMILSRSERILLHHCSLTSPCICSLSVCLRRVMPVTWCCVSVAAVWSCYSSACRPWNLLSDRDLILFPKSDTNLCVPFLQRARRAKAEGQPLCPCLGPQVYRNSKQFQGV